MSVAALYDIHGNLPALEAVLEQIAAAEVEQVLIGGDVLPGPLGNECLSLLRELEKPVRCIRGNGENDTLAVLRGEPIDRVPPAVRPILEWTAAALGAADRDWLQAWPATADLDIEGLGGVLFCHATPRDDNEIFTRRTPASRVAPALAGTSTPVIVCGHTHMQFDRRIEGQRVVNAGSVGMPFGAPGADWLLLGPGVELRHTDYDLDAAAARVSASEYPGAAQFPLHTPPAAEGMLEMFEAASI